MRRLTDPDRDDRGVATIFLILAMTAILIGAGFAIDVGQYVVHARSAQNSADATALAVATDCALTGAPIADYSPYRKSGQEINDPVCGDYEAVITVTKDVEGLLLKQSAGAVNRTATAKWGTLSEASTVPIVIAKCEWEKYPLGDRSDIIIHLPDPKKLSGCASGPGGFGQLDGDGCYVPITTGLAPGKPGNDVFKQIPCITNPTGPALPSDIMIPIFDESQCPTKGCQGNELYPIIGFAVFHLTGYSFNGNNFGGNLGKNDCDKAIGMNCIRGDFMGTTTSAGTPGPSTDFGLLSVYLSS